MTDTQRQVRELHEALAQHHHLCPRCTLPGTLEQPTMGSKDKVIHAIYECRPCDTRWAVKYTLNDAFIVD